MTQVVPVEHADGKEHRRRIATTVNQILGGKINATGTVTLTANAATSTLTNSHIGYDSLIVLSPTTANASAEIGNGTIYIGTYTTGSCTITHANNAQTDRTFKYAVLG